MELENLSIGSFCRYASLVFLTACLFGHFVFCLDRKACFGYQLYAFEMCLSYKRVLQHRLSGSNDCVQMKV